MLSMDSRSNLAVGWLDRDAVLHQVIPKGFLVSAKGADVQPSRTPLEDGVHDPLLIVEAHHGTMRILVDQSLEIVTNLPFDVRGTSNTQSALGTYRAQNRDIPEGFGSWANHCLCSSR